MTPPVPASEADERHWWADPGHRREFWRHAEPVEVEPEERKEVMSVRLRPSHASRLRQLAKARGMGHVTLLRRVVEEWIEHAPTPARTRSAG